MIFGSEYRPRRGTTHYETVEKKVCKTKLYGIDPRALVNKDSPDYKPNYGKTFTERQLKILNEEIPLDQVRLQEIAVIKNKAEALGDDEKVEIAKTLYAFKTGAEEYKFAVSVEDAKATLQSLTPWEIDWGKQK